MPVEIKPGPEHRETQPTRPRGLPVEKTIHRHALSRITALAMAPQEGALLVVGGLGAGKSRLLAAVDLAPDVDIHRLRINPAEAGLPLSGLSAIISSLQYPEAVELSGKLLSAQDNGVRVAERAAELLVFIHHYIKNATLLLIDDIDQMDHDSQIILSMVATRLGGTGLCIVGTASTIPAAGPLESLPRLDLGRLDLADSTTIASDLTRSTADDAVLRIVVSASSGNPQALAHTVRRLTPQQLAGSAPLVLPFTVAHSGSGTADPIEAVSAEPDSLLARLSCAAVSSHEAIAREFDAAQELLEELLSDGSVRSSGRYLSIGDPLIRSRVYWSLDKRTRRDLHAAAARSEAPDEPGLAAWHRSWLDSDSSGHDEMLVAATGFATQGLIGPAVEFAERALALDHDAVDSSARLYELALALLDRGELSYAVRYARLGQRRPGAAHAAPRLAILRTNIEFLSTQRLLTEDVDDWVSMSRGENPDDAAFVLSTIALCHAERWELEAARESLKRAHVLLEACSAETVDTYNRAATLLSAFEGDPGPSNTTFDRVSRHGVANTPTATLAWLGRSLSFLDRHAEARRTFKAIINLEPAPDPVWLETTRYWQAENEILAGNQFEAMAAIDQLDRETPDLRLHQRFRQLLMTWYWQAKGNRKEADAAIAECHRSFADGDTPALSARLAAYQGRFALIENRFEDAIAFLRMTASIGAGFRNPTMQQYQVDLIEAYTASGRMAEATEQFRQFHRETLRRPTRWTSLAAARANALVTPGEAGITAFQQAIRAWHPGDLQFELGRTVLGYADRLRSLGHQPESREQYLAARMIFTQLGAMSWARKAESQPPLREAVQEHPLLALLAPDERVVAELVCQGLRNKEIASQLFVSVRTVEVRLTRIYQKLGARSRAHLTAMLTSSEAISGTDQTAS